MSDSLRETLGSMTPAQLDGIQRLLDAIRASITQDPRARRRPRARPRPVVKLPEGVSPDELDRARRELEGR